MSAGLKANSDGVSAALQLNGADVAQITSAGIIAPNIHAADIKTTPVGNDEFGIWNSVTGFLNRMSWTNFLASLRGTANTWTQSQTFSADTSLVSVNGGQLAGFRNKIINGCCRVAQRGNVSVTSATNYYGGADRIAFGASTFTTCTGTILGNTALSTLYGTGQQATVSTTGTGVVYFFTRLEQRDTYALNSKTVTFSCKVYQDTGSALSFAASLFKANSIDNFGAMTLLGTFATVSVPTGTGTWTTISGTLTLGAADASNGLNIQITSGTLGAITSKNFYTSEWQLEVGSVATPFEQRPYGLELQLCQRYYETGIQHNWCAAPGTGYSGTSSPFKVTKRVQPTIVPTGGPSATVGYIGYFSAGNGIQVASTAWTDNSTVDQVSLPLTSNVSCYGTAFQWTASAEL